MALPSATKFDLKKLQRPTPGTQPRPGAGAASVARVAIAIALIYGLLLRCWLLAHEPVTSDQAVVGLMAHQILHGHFATFYWGQAYGGGESYVVALVFLVVGSGPLALSAAAALLTALAAIVVRAIVRRATALATLASAAGAIVWVWPFDAMWNSVRENGFRELAVCAGLIAIACALRIQRSEQQTRTYAFLGLAVGIGWWASPEIVYFGGAIVVLLIAGWRRVFARGLGKRPIDLLSPATVVVFTLFGALPWIYTNIQTNWISLQTKSLHSTHLQQYGDRLKVFFHEVLPIQLGVRSVPNGGWVGGIGLGEVLFGIVGGLLIAALLRSIWMARRGRQGAPFVAFLVTMAAFPFIYADVPSSAYWEDGRYGIFLPPLVIAGMAIALGSFVKRKAAGDSKALPKELPSKAKAPSESAEGRLAGMKVGRRGASKSVPARVPVVATNSPSEPQTAPVRRGAHAAPRAVEPARKSSRLPRRSASRSVVTLVAAAAVLGSVLLSIGTASAGGVPNSPSSFMKGWRDPEGPARHVVQAMERAHIHNAYGDYWTSYVLDFLSSDSLNVSPSRADVVRWHPLASTVAHSHHIAWLFFSPKHRAEAAAVFGNPEPGPQNYTEKQFKSYLQGVNVGYRAVHLGILDAIIPDRKVRLPHS